MTFTVRKTAPTLCLYLEPVRPDGSGNLQGTVAHINRLGDLPPRHSRLVATHVVGTDEILTEDGCPIPDARLAALFQTWYGTHTVPGVDGGRFKILFPSGFEENRSFARMADQGFGPDPVLV